MEIYKDLEDVRKEFLKRSDEAGRQWANYTEKLRNWENGERTVSKTGGLNKTDLLLAKTAAGSRETAFRQAAEILGLIDEALWNYVHRDKS